MKKVILSLNKVSIQKLLKNILIIIISFFIINLIIIIFVGLNDNYEKSDVILIFGNKVETNGQPSKRLQSRLDEGIKLYNQGLARLIVVSGGLGQEGYEESEIMKKYLLNHKIPENNIIEDKYGYNTYLTAINLKKIISKYNINKVIIISQYYHILRAKLAIKKIGIKKIYSSHAKMFPEIRDLYSIPREVFGYYSYLFKSY